MEVGALLGRILIRHSRCQSPKPLLKAQHTRYSLQHAVRRACSGVASSDLSLTQRYDDLVSRESLHRDTNQLRVIEHLEELSINLCNYHPTEPGLLQRLFGGAHKSQKKVKGVYIYGSVGSGKTMLMDMFYSAVNMKRKQRIHFNEFMLNTHNRIHEFKKSS